LSSKGPVAASAANEQAEDLDTKIVRGSAWALFGYGGAHALSLVALLASARLLVPDDFGVVALALSLLAAAQIAQESGLSAALIVYRGDLRPAAASASIFSPLVACGLYVAYFVAAPIAADFFDEPSLTDVLRVMALMVIFRGLGVMPVALLERDMRFGPLTAMELGAGFAQAVTTILLAFAGAGVWSLVVGQLAFVLVRTGTAWIFSPLRPSPLEAQRKALRDLMRFGRSVGAANLINYGNANAQRIVVGRVLDAAALGYYSVAGRLSLIPVICGKIVGRGVFAALARTPGDPERFRQIWLENVQRLALLAVPAAIGVAVVAEPFVVTILGSDWLSVVVPLQLLALSSIPRVFAATSSEVFQALHRPRLRVLTESLYLALFIPALVVGSRSHGLDGAAAAVLVVHSVLGIAVAAALVRILEVEVGWLARAMVRPAVASVLMAVSMLGLWSVVDEWPAALALVALIGVGVGVYAVSVALFARDLVVTMWVSLRGARTTT
jgi:lipopolysaccharide exporter